MSGRWRAFAAVGLLLASGARGATVGDLIDWIEKTRADCGLDSLPSPVEIHIKVEFHSTLTAAEADAMRAEVAGKPDHPKRAELQQYDREIKAGPQVQRRAFFVKDSSHWRFNQDFDLSNIPYYDTAYTPDEAWSLSSTEVSVMDPRTGSAPDRTIGLSPGTLSQNIQTFTCAGTHWSFDLVCDRPREAPLESPFRLVFNRGAAPTVVIIGDWIDSEHRAQINEMFLARADGRKEALTRYEQWRREPTLDRLIPSRVSEYSAEGRLVRVLKFDSTSLIPEERFQELVQLPSFDGSDPFRGKIIATRMRDFRPDAGSITRRLTDGSVTTAQLPDVAPRDYWFLRVAGWVASLALILGLVIARVLRRG